MALRSSSAKWVLAALVSTATAQGVGQTNSSACDTLQQSLGNITVLPGSAGYTNATEGPYLNVLMRGISYLAFNMLIKQN